MMTWDLWLRHCLEWDLSEIKMEWNAMNGLFRVNSPPVCL